MSICEVEVYRDSGGILPSIGLMPQLYSVERLNLVFWFCPLLSLLIFPYFPLCLSSPDHLCALLLMLVLFFPFFSSFNFLSFRCLTFFFFLSFLWTYSETDLIFIFHLHFFLLSPLFSLATKCLLVH